MRIRFILAASTTLALAACAGEPALNPGMNLSARQQEYADAWAVRSATDAQIARGVAVGRTVYPYQFEGPSAVLTDAGKHDLAILADECKAHPGSLTVVRGDASDQLYEQRLATVRQTLQDAGADVSRIVLSDAPPNGEGVTSKDILDARKADSEKAGQTGAAAPSGYMSSDSTGAPR